MIPLAVMMFLPYITGDWHSSNLHNNISATRRRRWARAASR